MPRITVFGPSGSGKSTLSEELALSLGVPFIELDALLWEPGFVAADDFLSRAEKALKNPSWIVDGFTVDGKVNHKGKRVAMPCTPIITHAIWLDFPLYVVLFRLLRRTFWRWWSKELLWGKCRETLHSVFGLNDDGLLYAMIRNFWARRKEKEEWVKYLRNQGIPVWVFTSPYQVEDFLDQVKRCDIDLFRYD